MPHPQSRNQDLVSGEGRHYQVLMYFWNFNSFNPKTWSPCFRYITKIVFLLLYMHKLFTSPKNLLDTYTFPPSIFLIYRNEIPVYRRNTNCYCHQHFSIFQVSISVLFLKKLSREGKKAFFDD